MKLPALIALILAPAALGGAARLGTKPKAAGPATDIDALLAAPGPDGVTYHRVPATKMSSPDEPAAHYQSIRHLGYQAGHSASHAVAALQKLAAGGANSPPAPFSNATAILPYSTQYATEVGWDVDNPQNLVIDTGSSDTWTIAVNYTCVSRAGIPYPESACAMGPATVSAFRNGPDPQRHLAAHYGSGESVSGPLGAVNLTLAGGALTVENQLCGLVNQSYIFGNNVTTGILGLGFAALTSAFYGNATETRPAFAATYPPVFDTLVSQTGIANKFSLMVDRDEADGWLAFGGLGPYNADAAPIVTDLLIANMDMSGEHPEMSYEYSFYTVVVDGWSFGQTTTTDKYLYVVDSGTTLCYLPPNVATQIAAAYDPPAVYFYEYGAYFAPCDATPPADTAVIVAGTPLRIDPRFLMYRDLVDQVTGYCATGITSGGPGPFILGDVMLQNVVALFDVGAAEMKFYPRAS